MTPNEAILELAKQQKVIAEAFLKQSNNVNSLAEDSIRIIDLLKDLSRQVSFWRGYSGFLTGVLIVQLLRIIWP